MTSQSPLYSQGIYCWDRIKTSCGGAGDSLSEDKDNSASLSPDCMLFPFTELAVWQCQVENEFALLVSEGKDSRIHLCWGEPVSALTLGLCLYALFFLGSGS